MERVFMGSRIPPLHDGVIFNVACPCGQREAYRVGPGPIVLSDHRAVRRRGLIVLTDAIVKRVFVAGPAHVERTARRDEDVGTRSGSADRICTNRGRVDGDVRFDGSLHDGDRVRPNGCFLSQDVRCTEHEAKPPLA